MGIKQAIHRFFLKRDHYHIIKVYDIAMGIPEIGIPLTAFRYRCILCGVTFDDICESGMRQLIAGNPVDKVLRWDREEPEIGQ